MPNPNGAVAGNDQNQPVAQTPRTRSTFPLHAHFFNTHRFGEYMPHYVDDLTKDDRYPVRSSGTLRSYTLKSPIMQNVKRNKDYFLVPMEAILPNHWEKFFDNPVRGDDVLDDVGPTVENFWSKVYSLMNNFFTQIFNVLDPQNSYSGEVQATAIFRYLVLGEYFYSNGSLLSSLGCHGASYVSCSWDDYFDHVINCLIQTTYINFGQSIRWKDKPDFCLFTLNVDGYYYQVSITGKKIPNYYPISLRHALQLIRDNPTARISSMNNYSGGSSAFDGVAISEALGYQYQSPGSWFNPDLVPTFYNYNVDCNLSRLWAYQLSVAHYFTNDHIDFVYSAELYRQLIGNYILSIGNSLMANYLNFTRNGVTYRYDYLSAHFCTRFFTLAISSGYPLGLLTGSGSNYLNVLGYFSALFGYRRSLRYLDYFTGSRAQPLAVVNTNQINTNVAVNANQVSVIDITKSIQAQRFLNSVNRVRHNFEGYLKGIFGGKLPAPDYHNPFYMAHTDDVVFGQETENTATEQMTDNIAITTNLRSNSGNYMFEIDTDRPCIIIGITSYDIARIYTRSMERSFLHKNRFDWFNPFMQYIGDQPVYLQELGINPNSGLSSLKNFAYQLRHMEFKQKFNTAAGGFCNPSTDLDLWIFPAKDGRGDQDTINPDWIRSLNAEFDQFFVSLSGWSLGTYFHFIVDDFNSVNANRPMAYSPQILG